MTLYVIDYYYDDGPRWDVRVAESEEDAEINFREYLREDYGCDDDEINEMNITVYQIRELSGYTVTVTKEN